MRDPGFASSRCPPYSPQPKPRLLIVWNYIYAWKQRAAIRGSFFLQKHGAIIMCWITVKLSKQHQNPLVALNPLVILASLGTIQPTWRLKPHRTCRWFDIFVTFIPPTWGNDPIWRAYFSIGLTPPTSQLVIQPPWVPSTNQLPRSPRAVDIPWWCSFY